MDPLTMVNALNAALTLSETLLPVIQQHVQSGEITAEQQGAVRAAYDRLRTRADGQFSGPEWVVAGATSDKP
jgi:hypothetical protein